jgi:CDP-glucose 4,6-dehydratase
MESVVMERSCLSYYKGKKVFVTGHTGFKGSWLLAVLKEAGAIIKGYALPPEYAGLFNLMQPLHDVDSVIDDIRNKKVLENAILSFQPDFIFHLAAQPLVRRSYQIPAETFEINVVGTANLLEIVNKLPTKCTVVVVTTDKVYENREENVLYNEDDRLGGYDPYSASKAATEITVTSFRNSFFNLSTYNLHKKCLATVRAGNVIGGGDRSTDRIVPDIVKYLEQKQPVIVRNPRAVRPWQHVLEPLSGYLKLGALLDKDIKFSQAYNFGPLPADHLRVKELVEKAIQIWGEGSWSDMSGATEVHEAGILKLNIQKAERELDWHPKLTAAEAIEWTISWYKQPVEKQLEFTFQQIRNYFEL